MKFLLMPLELMLMVVFVARNCMTSMQEDCGPEPSSSLVARDPCAGLRTLKQQN